MCSKGAESKKPSRKDSLAAPKTPRPSAPPSVSSAVRSEHANDAAESRDSDPTQQETPAKTCRRCSKLKPAPRGKKLSYRSIRGKYMYVPKYAHDEEERNTSVQAQDLPEVDQDDEELFSQAGLNTTEPQGDVQDYTNLEASEDAAETATENLDERTNEEQIDDVAATVQSSMDLPEADHSPVEGTTPVSRDLDHSRIKKRSAEAWSERPTKQCRVEIDLTEEGDDDVVLVKTRCDGINLFTPENAIKEEEDDLKAQLEEVEEQLRLRRKRAELQQRLRELRARGRSISSSRAYNFIKIED